MTSRMIALVTAASVALAGMAGPVAAGKNERDALKIILGAAAIGLLINELQKDKKRRPAPVLPPPPPEPKPAGVIPGECVYEVNTSAGRRDVVSSRCLDEFGVRRLPAACAFDIRTSSGTSRVYGPNCLAQNGWRVGRSIY